MSSTLLQPQPGNRKKARVKPGCCGTARVGEANPNAPLPLSDEHAHQYADWFRVLADPTRLRILNLLARNREPLCVCDIVNQFDLGQPTISHHLKILRDSCFVTTERHANFIYYSINPDCVTTLPQAARLIMGV